jgi:acetyl-CoA C-acetyltransferase
MELRDAVIVSSVRTPIGAFGGTLKAMSHTELATIRIGSLAIGRGDADANLAGGGESMSNIPYVIKNARWGLRLRHQELTDALWDSLTDHHTGFIMGMTAENVAEQYGVSIEDQDVFAYTSQMRTKKALESGQFNDEIVPVVIPGRKGKKDTIVDTDEHPHPDVTLEGLNALPTAFKKDGSVTAGNSSGINEAFAAPSIAVERELGLN